MTPRGNAAPRIKFYSWTKVVLLLTLGCQTKDKASGTDEIPEHKFEAIGIGTGETREKAEVAALASALCNLSDILRVMLAKKTLRPFAEA